jgi:hypothetical protein
MKKIWCFVDDILTSFIHCFKSDSSFHWFVIAIIGIIVRGDDHGVTSIVRGLQLNPSHYESLVRFFHTITDELRKDIVKTWIKIVLKTNLVHRVNGMPILIGDGIKTGKESHRMPAVKWMHQESGDTSKREHMQGLMFGSLGILIGKGISKTKAKYFSLPVSMTIQDGCKEILGWMKNQYAADSHVTRLVKEACEVAKYIGGQVLVCMDRYFLSTNALISLNEAAKKTGSTLVTLITRAKDNAVAYEDPTARNPHKRGRPAKKGKKVALFDLFANMGAFTEAEVSIYGKKRQVKYLCRDLLWGRGILQKLRFVLVYMDGVKGIFVSTSFSLEPVTIIELYSFRFKIETCFRAFTQLISGFGFHFWSRIHPYFRHNESNKKREFKIAGIKDEKTRAKIIGVYQAMEAFVTVSCIALGILQICSLLFSDEINAAGRWLRTYSNEIPSEETTCHYLSKNLSGILCKCPEIGIAEIVSLKSVSDDVEIII